MWSSLIHKSEMAYNAKQINNTEKLELNYIQPLPLSTTSALFHPNRQRVSLSYKHHFKAMLKTIQRNNQVTQQNQVLIPVVTSQCVLWEKLRK